MINDIILWLAYLAIGMVLGLVSLPWKSTSNRYLDRPDWSTFAHLSMMMIVWPYMIILAFIPWAWSKYHSKWDDYFEDKERFKHAQSKHLNSTNASQ